MSTINQQTPKSMTIELNYFSIEEAITLLRSIHKKNINLLGNRIYQSGDSYMKVKVAYSMPLVEPTIKKINGKECLIYQSSMNESN